jgi:hypothetical protein
MIATTPLASTQTLATPTIIITIIMSATSESILIIASPPTSTDIQTPTITSTPTIR